MSALGTSTAAIMSIGRPSGPTNAPPRMCSCASASRRKREGRRHRTPKKLGNLLQEVLVKRAAFLLEFIRVEVLELDVRLAELDRGGAVFSLEDGHDGGDVLEVALLEQTLEEVSKLGDAHADCSAGSRRRSHRRSRSDVSRFSCASTASRYCSLLRKRQSRDPPTRPEGTEVKKAAAEEGGLEKPGGRP